MELYKVPDNSFVKVLRGLEGPPGARNGITGEVLFFHHVDGMYSYCKDKDGNTVHLKAWTEVEVVEGFEECCHYS